MILTLTLNPAVDKTVRIDDFQVDQVNRIQTVRLDAGGKGINVARVVAMLGQPVQAMGILAGGAGRFIQSQLDKLGINGQFLFVPGETRTNLKVVDLLRKTNTDLNEPGPALSEQDLDQICRLTLEALNPGDVLVLSGSVPRGVSTGIYGRLVDRAKERRALVLLDADGELLEKGLEAGPYLVKPNLHELERLYQTKAVTLAERVALAGRLFDYPIEVAALSLGGEGALFLTRKQSYFVEGLTVPVVSTVGAGDAMVGALAAARYQQLPFEEAMALSIATAAASVTTAGTEPGDRAKVEQLKGQVQIQAL